jgi:hypothetical protein
LKTKSKFFNRKNRRIFYAIVDGALGAELLLVLASLHLSGADAFTFLGFLEADCLGVSLTALEVTLQSSASGPKQHLSISHGPVVNIVSEVQSYRPGNQERSQSIGTTSSTHDAYSFGLDPGKIDCSGISLSLNLLISSK